MHKNASTACGHLCFMLLRIRPALKQVRKNPWSSSSLVGSEIKRPHTHMQHCDACAGLSLLNVAFAQQAAHCFTCLLRTLCNSKCSLLCRTISISRALSLLGLFWAHCGVQVCGVSICGGRICPSSTCTCCCSTSISQKIPTHPDRFQLFVGIYQDFQRLPMQGTVHVHD